MISFIIPVLHEQHEINRLLKDIKASCAGRAAEIIVIDGGASSDTIDSVIDRDILCLRSPAGRAAQMNKGAAAAKGDILFFVHADTRLPREALKLVESAIAEGYPAGAFSLSISGTNLWLKIVAYAATLRSRFTKVPYGDQAIFIEQSLFSRIGGYKDVPLMEDVELMRSVKKAGGRVRILDEKVETSPRRWEKKGYIKTTVLNNIIRFLYMLGADARVLKDMYYKN